jgi:hypothetical protein
LLAQFQEMPEAKQVGLYFLIGVTLTDMKAASFEYIEVSYGRKRQHSTLGYRSAIRYLEQWTDERNQEKRAA